MTRNAARPALATLVLLLTACAAPPRTGTTTNERGVLLAEEMQKAGYPDAYTTVQTLRPQWLQTRGATSFRSGSTIKVYLDGSLMGGPEQLRQITTRSIASIRYLSGLEASERWGLDHGMGAIVVTTRK